MTNFEEWRDVKGYEGLYQVSNLGRIKSLSNKSNHKETKILSLSKVQGYMHVALYKNSKQKIYKVHRLVAMAFLNNPLNLPQVNHINGKKDDNTISNLEWISAKDNARHAHRIGLAHAQKGAENNRSKKVIQMSMDNKPIVIFYGMREAERVTGIGHSYISLCCRGKMKSAGGYKWKLG